MTNKNKIKSLAAFDTLYLQSTANWSRKKIFTLDWSFVTIIFTVHIVMDKKWFITTTKNDLRSEENVKK